MLARPTPGEYAPFYETYVRLVPEDDLLGAMQAQAAQTKALLAAFTDPDQTYAPGKWTVRQLVGHLTDTERVFGGRALWVARGDPAALPGFDQDHWMAAADYGRYTLAELGAEFALVRAGHLSFLGHLGAEAWGRAGVVNGQLVSVRALGYLLLGHERHHLGVLRERYLG